MIRVVAVGDKSEPVPAIPRRMTKQGEHSLSKLAIQIYSDGTDPDRRIPPGGGEWRERCKDGMISARCVTRVRHPPFHGNRQSDLAANGIGTKTGWHL